MWTCVHYSGSFWSGDDQMGKKNKLEWRRAIEPDFSLALRFFRFKHYQRERSFFLEKESGASFLKKGKKEEWKGGWERSGKPSIDGTFWSPFPLTPWFWFRKGSTQESDFKAISGVFPYPNGSCKKIGFHIELKIYAGVLTKRTSCAIHAFLFLWPEICSLFPF